MSPSLSAVHRITTPAPPKTSAQGHQAAPTIIIVVVNHRLGFTRGVADCRRRVEQFFPLRVLIATLSLAPKTVTFPEVNRQKFPFSSNVSVSEVAGASSIFPNLPRFMTAEAVSGVVIVLPETLNDHFGRLHR
jgi:hypothetical protein